MFTINYLWESLIRNSLTSPTDLYNRTQLKENIDYIFDWEYSSAGSPKVDFAIVNSNNPSKFISDYVTSNKMKFKTKISNFEIFSTS